MPLRLLPALLLLAACGRGAPPDDDPDDEAGCAPFSPPPPLPASTLGPDGGFSSEVIGRDGQAACLVLDDLDGDGRNDLVTVHGDGGSVRLVARFGDGTRAPTPVEFRLTIADDVIEVGACTVEDVDGDGDSDILLATAAGVVQLALEDRTFSFAGQVLALPDELAAERLVPELLVLIDLDGEGPLDLIQGLHGRLEHECPDPDELDTGDLVIPAPPMRSGPVLCYVADGEGGYVPAPPGVCPDPMLLTDVVAPYGAEVGDFDHDGDGDLVLVTDFGQSRFYHREPSGLVPVDGVGVDVYDHAMGVASADFDGDGLTDLFITDLGPTEVYLGACNGAWFQAGRALGLWRLTLQTITWGAVAVDVDHNGTPDLVVGMSVDARESPSQASMCIGENGLDMPHPPTLLLLNQGEARFERHELVDLPDPPGLTTGTAVRIATGDLDGDLAPDMVVSTGHATSILWNDAPKAGPVLRVRPLDATGRPAVGARVELVQGEHRRYRDLWRASGYSGVSEQVAHFGLGATDAPPTVEVRWPDGRRTTHGPYDPVDAEVVVRP